MTAEKQKLASKVSHLSEDGLLGLRHGLMSLGWVTAGQRLFSKSSVPLWEKVTLEGGETMMRGSPG